MITDEAEAFDREWQEKTKQAFLGLDYDHRADRGYERRRSDRRAVEGPRPREDLKALPVPRSEHWGETPDAGRRRREKY